MVTMMAAARRQIQFYSIIVSALRLDCLNGGWAATIVMEREHHHIRTVHAEHAAFARFGVAVRSGMIRVDDKESGRAQRL
jgi:hypothetical protein